MSNNCTVKLYAIPTYRRTMIEDKFPEFLNDIKQLGEWLHSFHDLDKHLEIRLQYGDFSSTTRGDALYPHMCPDGTWVINMYLTPIFGKGLHLFAGDDHLKVMSGYRTALRVLCHESVHVEQYHSERLEMRVILRNKRLFWNGEYWVGEKGSTYNSYRNLPWEVEAFDREHTLLDGYLKRKHLIENNSITLLSTTA